MQRASAERHRSNNPKISVATMKLCLISDTHNKHRLVRGMQEADLLLHAGDFSSTGDVVQVGKFNKWLGQQARYYDRQVVIPGNHDRLFEDNWDLGKTLLDNATVLNQDVFEYEGFTIYGEPRQPAFNDWAFNVERKDMEQVWAKVPPHVDILLTHGPPYGVGDLVPNGGHVGCRAQRDWIDMFKPPLVVCGHIHEGYGVYLLGSTVVVNASICTGYYEPINSAIMLNI